MTKSGEGRLGVAEVVKNSQKCRVIEDREDSRGQGAPRVLEHHRLER